MSGSLYSILISISFLLNIIMGTFLIIIPSKKRKANVILAILLLSIGLSTAGRELFLLLAGNISTSLDMYLSVNPFIFLFGPLIYIYILVILAKKRVLKIALLHTSPFIIITVIYIFLTFLDRDFLAKFGNILSIVKILHVLGYSIYLWLRVSDIERGMKEIYSSISKSNFIWIKSLILWFLAVFVYIAIIGTIILIPTISIPAFWGDGIVIIAITVWIISFWYRGIRQPDILQLAEPLEKEKYMHSSLKESDKERLFSRLSTFLENEKLYLDPELNIKELANKLEISLMDISQTINEKSGKGFFDFINGYRVDAFIEKIRMGEDKKYTFLVLAFECGFNSKSAFYNAFKKKTGKTPSQFKRDIEKI